MSVRSFHVPATPLHVGLTAELAFGARPRGPRASLPTRTTVSWSTIVLMVFFSSRISPLASTVIFSRGRRCATAVVTSAMLRTWPVRLPAMEVDVVGQVLPRAGDTAHLGLAAELAFGADLARHARDLGGEGARAGRPSC